MGTTTAIGWTEATWNPWHGCTKVSPGCTHCYMYAFKERMGQDPSVVVRSKSNFRVPLRWRDPRVIFTCSWSDWFIADADAWRAEAWEVIRQTPQHTYQILTKRPERIAGRLPWTRPEDAWPNVWVGVSIETQRYVAPRLDPLVLAPVAHRFVSAEPLLGSLDLTRYLPAIDWLIVGGESGPGYRPMDPTWAEAVVDDCAAADVAVYVKQDSGALPGRQGRLSPELWRHKAVPR
ncbi:MAG TPA: DUF5131 family protein [Sporichthya sp.]|jgi:protein gp37|nr:DUF5131 family protein [Sporichthya sp.]